MLEYTGADGIMIARGALRKSFYIQKYNKLFKGRKRERRSNKQRAFRYYNKTYRARGS